MNAKLAGYQIYTKKLKTWKKFIVKGHSIMRFLKKITFFVLFSPKQKSINKTHDTHLLSSLYTFISGFNIFWSLIFK